MEEGPQRSTDSGLLSLTLGCTCLATGWAQGGGYVLGSAGSCSSCPVTPATLWVVGEQGTDRGGPSWVKGPESIERQLAELKDLQLASAFSAENKEQHRKLFSLHANGRRMLSFTLMGV